MENSSDFRPAKKEVNNQLAAKLAGLDVLGSTVSIRLLSSLPCPSFPYHTSSPPYHAPLLPALPLSTLSSSLSSLSHPSMPISSLSYPLSSFILCHRTAPLGFPVDLAYVEDATIALLLSTEAQYFMDTMVVKDTNTSLQLFNRNQKSLALDQILPFKERGR